MRPGGFEGSPQPLVSSHGERLDRYSICIPASSPPTSRPVSPIHPSAVSREGSRQNGAFDATEGKGVEGNGISTYNSKDEGQAQGMPETAGGKRLRPELKGRAMLDSTVVKSEYNSMNRLFHTYMIMLRVRGWCASLFSSNDASSAQAAISLRIRYEETRWCVSGGRQA